jgi:GntR family transcriptional regulator/MocR family aminotransferase
VIYIGTFSKVMFPSLRLGYLVVPSDLVNAFTLARSLVDRHSPTLEQSVLADFIADGYFGRHIRKMRALYADKQRFLIDLLKREAGDLLEVKPSPAGLHIVAWLPEGIDDREVSREAAARGVEAQPLSAYSFAKQTRGALVLGYAAYSEREIRQGVLALTSAVRFCLSRVRRNLMMRLG